MQHSENTKTCLYHIRWGENIDRHEHNHGIVQIARYQYFWLQQLRYLLIADVMPLKRFQQLQRFLHVVDNSTQNDINATDKLFRIKPIIDMVRQQCIKVDLKESHLVNEKIIPCKTKRSWIRQYNPHPTPPPPPQKKRGRTKPGWG